MFNFSLIATSVIHIPFIFFLSMFFPEENSLYDVYDVRRRIMRENPNSKHDMKMRRRSLHQTKLSPYDCKAVSLLATDIDTDNENVPYRQLHDNKDVASHANRYAETSITSASKEISSPTATVTSIKANSVPVEECTVLKKRRAPKTPRATTCAVTTKTETEICKRKIETTLKETALPESSAKPNTTRTLKTPTTAKTPTTSKTSTAPKKEMATKRATSTISTMTITPSNDTSTTFQKKSSKFKRKIIESSLNDGDSAITPFLSQQSPKKICKTKSMRNAVIAARKRVANFSKTKKRILVATNKVTLQVTDKRLHFVSWDPLLNHLIVRNNTEQYVIDWCQSIQIIKLHDISGKPLPQKRMTRKISAMKMVSQMTTNAARLLVTKPIDMFDGSVFQQNNTVEPSRQSILVQSSVAEENNNTQKINFQRTGDILFFGVHGKFK